MKAVGLGVLFVAAMLAGAVSIYHLWEWLSLLSEGRSNWADLRYAAVWLGVLAVAALVVWQGVDRIDSGTHGHSA